MNHNSSGISIWYSLKATSSRSGLLISVAQTTPTIESSDSFQLLIISQVLTPSTTFQTQTPTIYTEQTITFQKSESSSIQSLYTPKSSFHSSILVPTSETAPSDQTSFAFLSALVSTDLSLTSDIKSLPSSSYTPASSTLDLNSLGLNSNEPFSSTLSTSSSSHFSAQITNSPSSSLSSFSNSEHTPATSSIVSTSKNTLSSLSRSSNSENLFSSSFSSPTPESLFSPSSSSNPQLLTSSSKSSISEFSESAKTYNFIRTNKNDNKTSTSDVPRPLTLNSPRTIFSWDSLTTFPTSSTSSTDYTTEYSTLPTPNSTPTTLSSSSLSTSSSKKSKESLTQNASTSSKTELSTDSTVSSTDYTVTTTDNPTSSHTKATSKYPLITYTRTQTQVWLVTQNDRIATHTSVAVIKYTLTPTFDARSATESIFGSLAAATSTVVAADAHLAANSDTDTGTSTGVIVGSVVGSIAGIALIVLVLMFFLTNMKKKKRSEAYGENATAGNMEHGSEFSGSSEFGNSTRGARRGDENNPFTNPSMLSISDHHAAVLATTENPFETSSRNRAGFLGKWWSANGARSPVPEAVAIPITADEGAFKRSGRGRDPGKPNTGASQWDKIPVFGALFSKKSKINHTGLGNSTEKSRTQEEDDSLPAMAENQTSFYRPPRRPSSCTVRKESHSREHSLRKNGSIRNYGGVSSTSPTSRMAFSNPYNYMDVNVQERSLFSKPGSTTQSSQMYTASPVGLTPEMAQYDSFSASPGAAVVIGVASPFLNDDIRSPGWGNSSRPANYQESNSIAYGMRPYDSSVYSSEDEEGLPIQQQGAKFTRGDYRSIHQIQTHVVTQQQTRTGKSQGVGSTRRRPTSSDDEYHANGWNPRESYFTESL